MSEGRYYKEETAAMHMNNERIARALLAALAIVGVLGIAPDANSQPRRRHRRDDNGAVANAQTPPAPQAGRCLNPQLADEHADAGRAHLRAGRNADAAGSFTEALRQCPGADLYEWLGRAREAQATTLVEDRARLEAFEAARAAYNQALEMIRADGLGALTPDTPDRIRSRIAGLEPIMMALRERLAAQQAVVEPPRPTVATCAAPQDACGTTTCHDLRTDAANCGRCGNACGRGQTCAAGVCRAIVAVTPPIVTPPASSWLTPARVTMIAGGAVTAAGLALLIPAQVEISRLDGQRCEETSAAQCYTYNNGDLRPETVRVIGAVTLGAGVAAVVTGAILQVTSSRSPERTPATRVSGFATPTSGGVILERSF